MGLVPRSQDGAGRLLNHGGRIRQLEIRRERNAVGPPFTVTHTLLRAGEVAAGEYIPPMVVEIDPLNDTPETKEIVGLGHVLRLGTATIQWLLNGTSIFPGGVPYDLATLDEIRPTITAASGAVDLSAYVTIRITPGG